MQRSIDSKVWQQLIQTDRSKDAGQKQASERASKQADRQTDRQTDRQGRQLVQASERDRHLFAGRRYRNPTQPAECRLTGWAGKTGKSIAVERRRPISERRRDVTAAVGRPISERRFINRTASTNQRASLSIGRSRDRVD